MKTLFQSFLCVLVVLCVSVFFCNCGGNSEMQKPQPHVSIVKFKDPSYKNNLIVTDSDESKHFVLMRGNECNRRDVSIEYDFPERLRNPFWELPDGWFLVDWAWNGMVQAYPYDGNTLLTEVTWDNYDGRELYDKTVPHIRKTKNDLFAQRDIRVADLMAYYYPDHNYPKFGPIPWNRLADADTVVVFNNQYFFHLGLEKTAYLSDSEQCLCNMVEIMDDYWLLLQKQLTRLIENGDLEKLQPFDVSLLSTK